MKIFSIVTLVDPNGSYGGPTRVAVNQARALIERGHEVTLVAAHSGFHGHVPDEVQGVPARLFPARRLIPRTGFAGDASVGMLHFLRHAVRAVDVCHLHLARDLVTLPAAALLRLSSTPFVVQTHGMVDASDRLLARLLDPVMTVPALRAAGRIFYLTPRERTDLASMVSEDVLAELPNGVPEAAIQADPATPEVLYVARLAERKRPLLFVEIASALAQEFPEHRFRLVGPDEGEATAVQAEIQKSRADIEWEGPLPPDATSERMGRAGVFVLPAVDEPYPMSVLEAMAVGLPVVLTDSCGLAPFVQRAGAGLVVDDSGEALKGAVRRLIADPELARRMGQAGRAATRQGLSMSAIASKLELFYRPLRRHVA